MAKGKALIIGAGPAGLTAALELQKQTDIQPIVLEASQEIGGLSRTVRYKGNRMDIGGHRFFSKNGRVMDWWLEQMPLGRGMLLRPRQSHIYYARRFFDYPLTLSLDTLRKLGFVRAVRICLSYLRAHLRPVRKEQSLEEFFINRFGRRLYRMFFQSYTEKVWGVACSHISADWGAQRIRGLSLHSAVRHSIRHLLKTTGKTQEETSLTRTFLYPQFGPGQLWEHVANSVIARDGQLHTGLTVKSICTEGKRITSVIAEDANGNQTAFPADFFLSTMPVRDLIDAMQRGGTHVPANVRQVADGLVYRDFITIGLLVDRLAVTETDGSPLKDTWMYIQESGVEIGRLQIFNNWSPHMAQPGKLWIGLEYFCDQSGPLWSMTDDELKQLGARELHQIGILPSVAFEDGHVVRVPKAYPAYFGSYDRFNEIREFTDGFSNLFLIGRNGMHKYNNQDHSMLTAMQAVENIARGVTTKDNLWSINAERTYHEEKSGVDSHASERIPMEAKQQQQAGAA